ncbi:MAG: flagellar export protein FliJ [Gammaproteobacteria bacterium]
MARRSRIQTLQRLAGHTEADHARRLAERLRALDVEERRLQQIRGYLAEYTQAPGHGSGSGHGIGQASAPPAKSMTISSLRSGRGFLERLRGAVDEQRGTVETQRQQVEQQTLQWRSARARTRSLEKLDERLEHQERDQRDRKEQGRLDEIATTRTYPGRKV